MFTFTAADGTVLYMGRDKHENEDLIKYAWPEDFWFHVRLTRTTLRPPAAPATALTTQNPTLRATLRAPHDPKPTGR